ncbi:MAG: DUF1566 domain-containing protein [Deltaproteobacteria bacterium]|nr:DUF1566 domain-containing protein [Deltaproteobacteria bacterium]
MVAIGDTIRAAFPWLLLCGGLLTCTACASDACTKGQKVDCDCGGQDATQGTCSDDGTPICLCGGGGAGGTGGSTSSGDFDWSKDQGVVTDGKTGWMWQRTIEAKTVTWEGAKQYCADLALAGYDDWQLPHKDDLLGLVLNTTTTPAIDTTAFPGTPAKPFWTRTLYAPRQTTHAWGVDFEDGGEGYAAFEELHHVRCYRGAP